ncbi:hypothetical protein RND71_041617 [Anisodus tanguticus]|uniref:Uncharacterized protein n=1 Tax=Anisodus tanguticus TaxID=243964 RepID=A0AAE1QV32_9SOLA|nr:hypothetical protein RND71_041617 [Anisodus tanguticus]
MFKVVAIVSRSKAIDNKKKEKNKSLDVVYDEPLTRDDLSGGYLVRMKETVEIRWYNRKDEGNDLSGDLFSGDLGYNGEDEGDDGDPVVQRRG